MDSGFRFKVAYTKNPASIQDSLDAGIIDAGDLVFAEQDGTAKLFFINKQNKILPMSGGVDVSELQEIVSNQIDEQLPNKIDSVTSPKWERFE